MTRTSALSILLVAALAAPSFAQPAPTPPPTPAPAEPAPVARLKPPAGWTSDDGRSAAMVKSLGNEVHFGGVSVGLDAQYLRSPTPGAILIASQVVTEALPVDPAAAATLELHAARDGVDAVDGAKVVRWDLRIDPAGRVHEALLEWTDPSVGTTVVSRTLVFRTKADLARITAECILGPDAADQRAVCEAALASLAPNTTALEPIAVTAKLPDAAPLATAGAPGLPSAPTIGEREGALPSTIMVKPPQAKRDRRPYYVIGGLLLLGLAWWWNRRERARRDALTAAAARKVGLEPEREEDEDKPS